MSINRIEPGPRYAEAVCAGGFIFCSGMVPADGTASIEVQTLDVLAQVDSLLAQCGASKQQLVDVLIYLADMADYNGMNQVWDQWLTPGHPPARATVEARLADPSWKIEIKVTAYRG